MDDDQFVYFERWSTHRGDSFSWKERFRIAWAILRGRSSYVDDVILGRKDIENLKSVVDRIHSNFPTGKIDED